MQLCIIPAFSHGRFHLYIVAAGIEALCTYFGGLMRPTSQLFHSRSCLRQRSSAGLMLSLGAEGALGFVVSHELVHGHHKMDQWLANVMLCTTGYMHWSVSHIAHHSQASFLCCHIQRPRVVFLLRFAAAAVQHRSTCCRTAHWHSPESKGLS